MKKQLALTALMCVVLLWWGCGDFDGDGNGFVPPPPPTVRSIDSEPDWSLDGETIAYTHAVWDSTEIQYGEFQIWLLDLETMEMRYLTEGMMPAWSPDGERIAFVRSEDIHVVDLETVEVARLTHWGECFYPSWSSDGQMVAFDYMGVIWLMSSDGSGKTEVLSGRDPDWSADGRTLVYQGSPGSAVGSEYQIWTAAYDGTAEAQLTERALSNRHPRWSRDGSQIAWESYGEGDDPSSGIWVMNADGSGQHQIIQWGGRPAWSPDGAMIAYTAYNEESNTTTLWLMNSDGTDPHPLTMPEDYE